MKRSIWLGLCFLSACALSHERSEDAVSNDGGTDFGNAIDAAVEPDANADLSVPPDMPPVCVDGELRAVSLGLPTSNYRASAVSAIDEHGVYVLTGTADDPLTLRAAGFGFAEDGSFTDLGSATQHDFEVYPFAIVPPQPGGDGAALGFATSGLPGEREGEARRGLFHLAPGRHLDPNIATALTPSGLTHFAATAFVPSGLLYTVQALTGAPRTGGPFEEYVPYSAAPDLIVHAREPVLDDAVRDYAFGIAMDENGAALTLAPGSMRLVVDEDGTPAVFVLAGIPSGSSRVPSSVSPYAMRFGDASFRRLAETRLPPWDVDSFDAAAVVRDGVEGALVAYDLRLAFSEGSPERIETVFVPFDASRPIARATIDAGPPNERGDMLAIAATDDGFAIARTSTEGVEIETYALEELAGEPLESVRIAPLLDTTRYVLPPTSFELLVLGTEFVLFEQDAQVGEGGAPEMRLRLTRVSRASCP